MWGCFGFLNKEEVIESFLVFGMAAGFFGNAGYVICLKFFSPVVVSAVFLVEPLLAQCFGWALGIDEMPGASTWIGTSLVFFGIALVQMANN